MGRFEGSPAFQSLAKARESLSFRQGFAGPDDGQSDRRTGASLPLGGRRDTLTSWITETENPSDPFWSEGVGKRLFAWSWV